MIKEKRCFSMRYGKRKKRFGAYDRRFCDVEAMVVRNLGFGDQYGPMGEEDKIEWKPYPFDWEPLGPMFPFHNTVAPLSPSDRCSILALPHLPVADRALASGFTVGCSTDLTIEYSINCMIQCYSMKYRLVSCRWGIHSPLT